MNKLKTSLLLVALSFSLAASASSADAKRKPKKAVAAEPLWFEAAPAETPAKPAAKGKKAKKPAGSPYGSHISLATVPMADRERQKPDLEAERHIQRKQVAARTASSSKRAELLRDATQAVGHYR